MNKLVIGAGILLPVFVFGHAIAAAAFLVLSFFHLPVGWSIFLSLVSLYFMSSGYKTMAMFNRNPDMIATPNIPVGPALVLGLALLSTVLFSTSKLPSVTSQWWGLLFPLVIVLHLVTYAAVQMGLSWINPAGQTPVRR